MRCQKDIQIYNHHVVHLYSWVKQFDWVVFLMSENEDFYFRSQSYYNCQYGQYTRVIRICPTILIYSKSFSLYSFYHAHYYLRSHLKLKSYWELLISTFHIIPEWQTHLIIIILLSDCKISVWLITVLPNNKVSKIQ